MSSIKDVLKARGHKVHSVEAGETLAGALRRFAETKIRCLAVTTDGRLVGLLSIRDAAACINRHGAAALDLMVEEAMTGEVIRATLTMKLGEAEALFRKHGFAHLPVQDKDGKLVGMITPADVLDRHLTEVQENATFLRDYIAGAYF